MSVREIKLKERELRRAVNKWIRSMRETEKSEWRDVIQNQYMRKERKKINDRN